MFSSVRFLVARHTKWIRRTRPSPFAKLATTASMWTQTAILPWSPFAGEGQSVKIGEGHQVRFTGTSLAHTDQSAPAPDDFDQWCRTRDQRGGTQSASSRYVGPGMVGADDLDQYGTWKDDSTYGNVWY